MTSEPATYAQCGACCKHLDPDSNFASLLMYGVIIIPSLDFEVPGFEV